MITLVALPIVNAAQSHSLTATSFKSIKHKFNEQTIHFWMMRFMAIAFIVVLLWIIIHIFLDGGDQQVKHI
jgi:hypothetical protein